MITEEGKKQHTPGPWIVIEYDGRGPMEVQSSENPGASLALVYAENPEIELQANAELIASAPTLLEENRKQQQEIERLTKLFNDSDKELTECSEKMNRIHMESQSKDREIEILNGHYYDVVAKKDREIQELKNEIMNKHIELAFSEEMGKMRDHLRVMRSALEDVKKLGWKNTAVVEIANKALK